MLERSPDSRCPTHGEHRVDLGAGPESDICAGPQSRDIRDAGRIGQAVYLDDCTERAAPEITVRNFQAQRDPHAGVQSGRELFRPSPQLGHTHRLDGSERGTTRGAGRRRGPRHLVGNGVDEAAHQARGRRQRRLRRIRHRDRPRLDRHSGGQPPDPVGVLGVQRTDPPGIEAGGGDPGQQAPPSDQLQRQETGCSPECGRWMRLRIASRPGQHRHGRTHRHPDRRHRVLRHGTAACESDGQITGFTDIGQPVREGVVERQRGLPRRIGRLEHRRAPRELLRLAIGHVRHPSSLHLPTVACPATAAGVSNLHVTFTRRQSAAARRGGRMAHEPTRPLHV